jgi:hypothetical protein
MFFAKLLSMKKLFLINILLFSFNAEALEIKNFETDGCTMFIDGNWGHCCYMHDLRYWYGGDHKRQDEADTELKNCVEKVAGINWATLIYKGVRLGHHSPIKNKYRWGWGWSPNRINNYSPLNESEKDIIKENLINLKQSSPNEEIYIEEVLTQFENSF